MPKVTDQGLERMISVVLASGVAASGTVVLVGGILFLIRHGHEPVDYRTFSGEPAANRLVHEIWRGAIGLRARSIIQLGVLLLIATPIARVAFSLVGFAFEQDRKYVVITLVVLVTLLYSLVSGAIHE